MKKILMILGIVAFAIMAILIIVPIIFKPQLVRMIREKASQSVRADVNFEDISLSLLRGFPNISLTINKLAIVNREPFSGDTLAYLDKFQTTLNLRKLIFGKQVEIVSLGLEKPRITVRILKDGQANYQIFPKTSTAAGGAKTPSSAPMNIAIRQYWINDGYLLYIDEVSDTYAQINGLRHEGRGDFAKAIFTLNTTTLISDLSFIMKGIPYLKNAELEIKADLEMDTNSNKFTFKENEIRLNQLLLGFDGWVQMADSSINLDLAFEAPQTQFKNILSMIPAIYKKDFGGLTADGQLSLTGKIQGALNASRVPKIDIRLLVENGMFQYSKLPTRAENIGIELQVRNPGGTSDDTEIDLRKFHVELMNEPIDAQLFIKTPVSDPHIDGFLKGKIDLSQVRNVLAINDSLRLAGNIISDFRFIGNISSLQKKELQQFTASGNVKFTDIEYASPVVPVPISIPTAGITFTPSQARLDDLMMRMGQSDLRASGGLDNIFGYLFGSQTLKGTLDLKSDYLDLNPFIEQPGGAIQAIELPDKVEFQMVGDFKELLLTNMKMTNVRGKILLKDRTMTLTDLTANFLDGTMTSNGTYRYVKPDKPHLNFDLRLSKLSIPEMYKTFVTVQKFAPMAGFMQGQVNGTLNLSSDLGDSLMPLWQTILSSGSLQIPEAKIEGFEPLNKVADALRLEQFRNPGIDSFSPSYRIKDGLFSLNPVNFKLGGYQVVASGANGLDKSLDYLLKVQIPTGELKNNVNSAISGLLKRDVSLLTNETVVVDVGVKGFLDNPIIQTSLAQITKGTKEQIQQQALQEAEKKRHELEQQAQQKLNEQKNQVADSLKKVIEKEKQEQTEKLKNKIKGLFGR